MRDFLDRVKKNKSNLVRYIDLNESESELYRGAGWAIALAMDGQIESFIYLNELEYENEEVEAKAAIKEAHEHSEVCTGNAAYLGMCSSYQFCDPVLISPENPTVAARIMRLSVEEPD